MIYALWVISAFTIFIYSYGFVDLNLTLSSAPLIFHFVSTMQQLVYFNRPISLIVFVSIILIIFFLYLYILAKAQTQSFPWKVVICISILLALAYPMLSSDVFKYLFGAKQILVYHSNPYSITPDTYSQDTWIRFMRWVHTPSPYGPFFILLTIPYYLLGLGKFVPVLYLFKIDQIAWYILAIWLVGKIKGVKAQYYFAFNPLVLMEWLVNAHNDAIMITLLLISIYLYTLKKTIWSFVTLLLSIGVKYVTVIFLPFIFIKKQIKFEYLICILLACLFCAPLLYHYSWQYQPWYVTWLVPLAAIIDNKPIKWSIVAYSMSAFSRYLFFIGTGSWLGTVVQHILMTFTLPFLIFLWYAILELRAKNK